MEVLRFRKQHYVMNLSLKYHTKYFSHSKSSHSTSAIQPSNVHELQAFLSAFKLYLSRSCSSLIAYLLLLSNNIPLMIMSKLTLFVF